MERLEKQADQAPRGGLPRGGVPRGGAPRRVPVLGALIAAIYVAAGLAFYLYSGRAEDMVSPRLGFLLVALTSVPLAFYLLIALIFSTAWPRAASRWLIIAGIGVSYLFIVLGYRLDGALTAETMARGDALIRDIEDYRRATGAYPADLGEIAAGGRTLPVPALEDSAFTYGRTGDSGADGGYIVAFPSVANLTCARTLGSPDWTCEDS